jgi:uncharacterized damage-inducible protein DinB
MKFIITFFLLTAFSAGAQDKSLPFHEISDHPVDFSAGSLASRAIDGLGFRYYWATEGLREQDLDFKPSSDSRTARQTLEHIYEMSILIVNATEERVNVPGQDKKLPFSEMRKATLENFQKASLILKTASDDQMKKFNFVYQLSDKQIKYPFWNLVNGPIEDCIWHLGQIVSFRRSSGNPLKEVDLFLGKPPK